MKRMTIAEMKKELDREIKAVAELSDEAFRDNDLDSFFNLNSRLKGLLYARCLLHGTEGLGCYQTGMNPNSHGAKYTKKVKV